MAVKVPPAVNYPSPLVAVPIKYQQPPREGAKLIACEIDWGTMGGANNTVAFNMSNNATLEFSQIVALSVDNSQSGTDVQFVFQDTSETVTIPAYSPKTIVEVFTNQTQFWCVATGAVVLSTDITRFSIHNTLPPPIAVPISEEQNTSAIATTAVVDGAPHTVPLVASTVNGTLEGMSINIAIGSTGIGTLAWKIVDGASNVIATGTDFTPNGGVFNGVVYQMSAMHVRFQDGLNLVYTATSLEVTNVISTNLYYRTP